MPPQAPPATAAASMGSTKDHGAGSAGHAAVEAHGGGGDAAERDLALAADVGEVGALGEDEAEADQAEREGAVDRGRDGIGRAPGAFREGGDRVADRHAHCQDERHAAGDGEEHRKGRNQERRRTTPHDPWGPCTSDRCNRAHAACAVCPAIRAPMWSRACGSALHSPMTRPR